MNLFGFGKPEERIEPELGLHLVREEGGIRVETDGHRFKFLEIDFETFLRKYRETLPCISFCFEPLQFQGEPIAFIEDESAELVRVVALSLLQTHLHHHVPAELTPEAFAHPNVWRMVLRQAEAKYGDRAEKAITLAAHTIRMDREEFAQWVRVEDFRSEMM